MVESERQLIELCLRGDRTGQEELYRRFAARMYGICLRYAGNALEAQDILQEGFIRVFHRLSQYRYDGSFEGWMRRIFINMAITLSKREMKYMAREPLGNAALNAGAAPVELSRLSHLELLSLINRLPRGYRTVFNLYAIDGYTHREIARLLGISVNTSKSQLSGARRNLRELLNNAGYDDGKERS